MLIINWLLADNLVHIKYTCLHIYGLLFKDFTTQHIRIKTNESEISGLIVETTKQ